MTRHLITGCECLAGYYLAEPLISKGQAVYGTVYENGGNLNHLNAQVSLLNCDIKKRDQVDDQIYVGVNSKLKSLGWDSTIPVKRTLRDIYAWWREQ